jgi:hypothetical protein
MDNLVAEAATLTLQLLSSDEKEYDATATSVAQRVVNVPHAQLASKVLLDVGGMQQPHRPKC